MAKILKKSEADLIDELKVQIGLMADVKVVKFVIFGSRARGDFDSKSDLDLAIILKGMDRRTKNRILDIIAELEFKYLTPISALVVSDVELELLVKKERRLGLDIEKEGVVV